jgi:phosphohistidine swiveling domain-containing protein
MIRIEHNAQTGEILEIEMTPEEIAAKLARDEAVILEQQEKLSSKAALLEKLGITEEEARLLLS